MLVRSSSRETEKSSSRWLNMLTSKWLHLIKIISFIQFHASPASVCCAQRIVSIGAWASLNWYVSWWNIQINFVKLVSRKWKVLWCLGYFWCLPASPLYTRAPRQQTSLAWAARDCFGRRERGGRVRSEKYCDSYTQFHNISIPLAFIGAERTKASFAIRRVFHEFNILVERCLDSRDLVSPSRRIEAERKKSKHFKCSYQVFPVDHIGFLKSL